MHKRLYQTQERRRNQDLIRMPGPRSLPTRLVAKCLHFLGDKGGGRRKTPSAASQLVEPGPGSGRVRKQGWDRKLGSETE